MHRTFALCCAVLIVYNSEAFKLFPTRHRQIAIVKYQEHSHQLTSSASVLLPSYNQQLISHHYHLPSSSPTTLSMSATSETMAAAAKRPFRIRTITSFVTLRPDDFDNDTPSGTTTLLATKVDKCNTILRTLEKRLTDAGYEVQTVRVATNPFGEWLVPSSSEKDDGEEEAPAQKKAKTDKDTKAMETIIQDRMTYLDKILDTKEIGFCSVGPSQHPTHTTQICPMIVATSGKFSCSANINAGDSKAARAAAKCMQTISTMGGVADNDKVVEEEEEEDHDVGDIKHHLVGGLGNFRFCAASCIETVPFFPGAKAPSNDDAFSFAIGLENGGFACDLLGEAKNIANIKQVFDGKMREQLMPIQEICSKFESDHCDEYPVKYLGIDTSLNPSLDDGGSVADAIESLEEVRGDFGGTGSMSAAAAVTLALQSIPDILTTGYSGLMLPVLEDQRLAELGVKSEKTQDCLSIQKLLTISSVCGVGIDTVPIPGDICIENLSSLILDVAALAGRWNKPLSCRVFPVPGGKAGEKTTFDSPYMCNSCIFDL